MATKALVLLLAIQVLAATHFASGVNGQDRMKWFRAILAKVDTYFNSQDANTQSTVSLPCEFLNAYALPGGSIDVKKGSVDIRCEVGKQLNIDSPSTKCTYLGISPSKKSKRSARSNERQKRDGNNNQFSSSEMRQLTARFGSKLPKCVDIPGYTGCYENTFDLDAVLNYMNFAYHPSSAADCVHFCGNNGFTLAGVYQHDEGSDEKDRCRCGTGQFPGNAETSKNCDRLCLKDKSQICGGNKEFAVFEVGPYMAVYGPKTTPTTEQPTTRSTTEKLLTTTTPEPTTTSSTTTTPEPTTTSSTTTTPEPTTTTVTTTAKTTTEKLVTPDPSNVTNTTPPPKDTQ
ncbi:cell wall integrity and stress response component 3-like [Lingula anatina]|uniref:Cell wall integrity and stress response component 3-like n=1 Tax=Lingula anatina TaxID=7574 RepID=A0A1S3IFM0_LINAN|nr:cell wall integrity and stress response component 3-like [Lingula anatina]|eukprot:XP_013396264.1 cell wall integrity and stress response component 3-like [Lingula anatina]